MTTKKIVVTAALVLLASSNVTNAALPVTRQENADKSITQICATLENKIDTLITGVNSNRKKHIEAYNNLIGSADNLLEKLNKQGYDTAKARSAAAFLNTKIIKFGKDLNDYKKALEDTRSYACGDSGGQYAAKLTAARELQKIVREDVQDIRQFYQKTLKSALNELKEQVPSPERIHTDTIPPVTAPPTGEPTVNQ
jgi:Mrp family chromosome partitioning ATPase